MQLRVIEDKNVTSGENVIDKFKEANKKLCEVGDLKCKKWLVEQQKLVAELKEEYQSFRNMASLSGISLKTVHGWCSLPKPKIHKAKALSQLRKDEYERFLWQDTISFAHPGKKFAGKRFLRDTLQMIRKKYLQRSQFHTHGILSMSSMKAYHPKYILLFGQTPLDQCLCDKCENCEQLLKHFMCWELEKCHQTGMQLSKVLSVMNASCKSDVMLALCIQN